MVGQSLGHYKITAKIGAGGMGEVYRATDTGLHREVAIKVLPAPFAADAQRMARFHREAQLLASLNHPHIAAIYGFEQSGTAPALVMELVEGPTLADRISMGPLALEDALPLARQIAEALEYAHEHGIIHRDLKPSNIKLTSDGQVKVLDFGLAKALGDDSAARDVSASPTLSMAATRDGIILGTASYMAPEQARASAVDRRADIWAFGVVLFEMLTGKRSFSGPTVSDTLAAVLKSDPDWAALHSSTPPAIRQLLRRCLERDARRRLRDIGEARICVDDAIAHPEAELTATAPGLRAEAPALRAWKRVLPWALVAALVLLSSGMAWMVFRSSLQPAGVVRAFILPPENTSFVSSGVGAGPVAVSPDGRTLAFVARHSNGNSQLWVRAVSSLSAQPLAGTERATYPFWSHDSRAIGFFAEGKLKKIDVGGGPAVTICEAPEGRGGSWNREDTILFAPSLSSTIHRVPASGGTPIPVTAMDAARGESTHRWPSFLPDGRRFVYFARGVSAGIESGANNVRMGSLDAGQDRPILIAQSNAVYADGHVLFVRESSLMARPFDPRRGDFTGDAFPIAEKVLADPLFSLAAFSASETGVLAYSMGENFEGSNLALHDRSGRQTSLLGAEGMYFNVAFSPDGRHAAVDAGAAGIGRVDIWIYELARNLRSRFTFDAALDREPVWSPDGTRIAFSSNRKGPFNLYQKSFTGTGLEEVLLESSEHKRPWGWSPDGRLFLYETFGNPKAKSDLWVLPLSGDRRPLPYQQTPFFEGQARFAPDGRWIAYVSDESGQPEVYVAAFPAPGRKWLVSSGGGSTPRWRRDSREIYYLAIDGKLMAVEVRPSAASFEVGALKVLFPTRPIRTGSAYDVTPDGKRFLVNSLAGKADTTPVTLVVNWTAGLKK